MVKLLIISRADRDRGRWKQRSSHFFYQQMEADQYLIKDCHSSNKKPRGSGGSKLLYQATAGKDMTVRGLCDEAELCGLLNVTPFFPYASDRKKKTNTRGQEVSACFVVRMNYIPHTTSLFLCLAWSLVNIFIYYKLTYKLHTGTALSMWV